MKLIDHLGLACPLAVVQLFLFASLSTAQSPPITSVVGMKVETHSFIDRVEALGTLQANERVTISSSTTDLITRVHFEDGQRVEEGALLLQMSSDEEEAQLAEARSAFEEAKKQYERNATLLKQNVVSASVVDQQRREFEVARARLRGIEARINDLEIRAPFSGLLGMRQVSKGALLQPGDTVTTIDDDSEMKLDFSIPAIHLGQIKEGMRVKATTPAFPDKVFSGTISTINSRIDIVTRSIAIRARIPNPDHLLRPGLLMNVQVLQDEVISVAVPEEALLAEGEKQYVYVVEGESAPYRAQKKEVRIGLRAEGLVEILDGLSEGELIVRDGAVKLSDGAKVDMKAMNVRQRKSENKTSMRSPEQ